MIDIEEIKKQRKAPQPLHIDNIDEFTSGLRQEISALEEILGKGVDIHTEELNQRLNGLKDINALVDTLTLVVEEVKKNKEVKVNGLDKIIEKIEKIKPSVKVITNDIYDEYKFSDKNEIGSVQYMGFVNRSGDWFIVRNTENTVRYARPSYNENSDYLTAIKSAGSLEYRYYYETDL